MMPAGWSFASLDRLWTNESGWRWNALNASSGAYGIPQSLPASKMASAGPDWHDNAITQIKWGLGYIGGRYGSSQAAEAFEFSHTPHWYDNGGLLPPGITMAVNQSQKPEAVLNEPQWRLLRQLAQGGGRAVQQIQNQYIADPGTADRMVKMLQFATLAGGGSL